MSELGTHQAPLRRALRKGRLHDYLRCLMYTAYHCIYCILSTPPTLILIHPVRMAYGSSPRELPSIQASSLSQDRAST